MSEVPFLLTSFDHHLSSHIHLCFVYRCRWQPAHDWCGVHTTFAQARYQPLHIQSRHLRYADFMFLRANSDVTDQEPIGMDHG